MWEMLNLRQADGLIEDIVVDRDDWQARIYVAEPI